jgi:hypothetical protein
MQHDGIGLPDKNERTVAGEGARWARGPSPQELDYGSAYWGPGDLMDAAPGSASDWSNKMEETDSPCKNSIWWTVCELTGDGWLTWA